MALASEPDTFLSMAIALSVQDHPQWTVIRVSGDLDVAGAPELRQGVLTAVADGARWITLDLSDLDFIDSFGIGAVVAALKRTRQRGGDLRLVCPVRRVRRVFEICGLDRIMTLGDTLGDLGDGSKDSGAS